MTIDNWITVELIVIDIIDSESLTKFHDEISK